MVYRYCECGCGIVIENRLTTNRKQLRFVNGHNGRGKHYHWTFQSRHGIENENNSQWKGDNAKYAGLHRWVTNHKKKFNICECCQKVKKVELANISGLYKRDIRDYKWLCRSCHRKRDKSFLNFKKTKNKANKLK